MGDSFFWVVSVRLMEAAWEMLLTAYVWLYTAMDLCANWTLLHRPVG